MYIRTRDGHWRNYSVLPSSPWRRWRSVKTTARGWHSIECIPHAGRAAPSRWAASQRNETAPHGCLVATFCTFGPCDLDLLPVDLILIGRRDIVIDHRPTYVKFGDFCFSRFGFIVGIADRITDADNRYRPILPRFTVGVSRLTTSLYPGSICRWVCAMLKSSCFIILRPTTTER